MATAQPLYHAPTFEPTVDEIATLKQLEMGQAISVPDALKHHLSGRLLDWAYIGKTPGGEFHITDLGRQVLSEWADTWRTTRHSVDSVLEGNLR